MANGDAARDNAITANKNVISWILGGGGGLALLVSFMLSISNNASIALDVARQHGEELNELRVLNAAIQLEMSERTQHQYTSIDAARDQAFIERRFDEIERKIEEIYSQ